MEDDWKLKLRYGILKTPFQHFTIIANGVVHNLTEGFECKPGNSWMAMKARANNEAESADMIKGIGSELGFEVTGKIEIFSTAPDMPPRETPYGYGINFHSYEDEIL